MTTKLNQKNESKLFAGYKKFLLEFKENLKNDNNITKEILKNIAQIGKDNKELAEDALDCIGAFLDKQIESNTTLDMADENLNPNTNKIDSIIEAFDGLQIIGANNYSLTKKALDYFENFNKTQIKPYLYNNKDVVLRIDKFDSKMFKLITKACETGYNLDNITFTRDLKIQKEEKQDLKINNNIEKEKKEMISSMISELAFLPPHESFKSINSTHSQLLGQVTTLINISIKNDIIRRNLDLVAKGSSEKEDEAIEPLNRKINNVAKWINPKCIENAVDITEKNCSLRCVDMLNLLYVYLESNEINKIKGMTESLVNGIGKLAVANTALPNRDDDDKIAVKNALLAVNKRLKNNNFDDDDNVRSNIALVIGNIATVADKETAFTAVQIFKDMLVDNKNFQNVRSNIALGLGNIATAHTTIANVCENTLNNMLYDNNNIYRNVSNNIVVSIGNIGSADKDLVDDSINILIKILKYEKIGNDVRSNVASAIGNIGASNNHRSNKCIQILKAMALNGNSNDNVRSSVALAIGNIGASNKDSSNKCIQILKSMVFNGNSNDNVRSNVALAVGNIGASNKNEAQNSLQILKNILCEDDNVRSNVFKAIGNIMRSNNFIPDFLRKLINDEVNPNIKCIGFVNYGKKKAILNKKSEVPAEIINWMMKYALKDDSTNKIYAIEGVGEIGTNGNNDIACTALMKLAGFIDKENDLNLRNKAAEGIFKIATSNRELGILHANKDDNDKLKLLCNKILASMVSSKEYTVRKIAVEAITRIGEKNTVDHIANINRAFNRYFDQTRIENLQRMDVEKIEVPEKDEDRAEIALDRFTEILSESSCNKTKIDAAQGIARIAVSIKEVSEKAHRILYNWAKMNNEPDLLNSAIENLGKIAISKPLDKEKIQKIKFEIFDIKENNKCINLDASYGGFLAELANAHFETLKNLDELAKMHKRAKDSGQVTVECKLLLLMANVASRNNWIFQPMIGKTIEKIDQNKKIADVMPHNVFSKYLALKLGLNSIIEKGAARLTEKTIKDLKGQACVTDYPRIFINDFKPSKVAANLMNGLFNNNAKETEISR